MIVSLFGGGLTTLVIHGMLLTLSNLRINALAADGASCRE